MDMMNNTIGLALMLMLVIEGLIYAAFPAQMKRLMTFVLSLPDQQVRQIGLGLAALGALGVWFYLKL